MKRNKKVIFGIVILLVSVFGYWWVNYHVVLDWPPEKIFSSPENIAKFLEIQLCYISKRISDKIIIPETNRSMKDHVEEFLYSKAMEKDVIPKIYEGKKSITGSKLHLILIPDNHGEVYNQSDESKTTQQAIYKYFVFSGVSLGLAENIYYPIDWENLYKDLLWITSEFKMPMPYESFQDFRDNFFKNRGVEVWWKECLKNPDSKHFVVGVDNRELNFFMTHFKQLQYFPAQYGVQEIQENINKVYFSLNFVLREQVILANVVIEMRKRSQDKAVIVLGSRHIKTFSALCKEWGVELEIAQL